MSKFPIGSAAGGSAPATNAGASRRELRGTVKSQAEDILGRLVHRLAASGSVRQKFFNAVRLNRTSVEGLAAIPELDLLAYVFARRHQSRSQLLQDLWVSFELDGHRDGFFVEFGATDGVTESNTALLEAEYGWHGILAEPNPAWHPTLERSRPAAVVDQRCVTARTGETAEFLVVEHPELSTLVAYAAADHFAEIRRAASPIAVETVTLNDLLSEHGAPAVIDYMSVDTEGSEYEILSAFDFHRWEVRLFSVEHNHGEQETRLDALLNDQGYERVYPELSQWDAWYRRA